MKICHSHDHACLGTEGWSAHLRQHHQQQQQHPHPQKQQRRKLLHLHRIYRRHRKRRYHALLLCLLLLYQKYLSRVDLWASILRRFHRNLKNSRKMIQLFKKFLRKGRSRHSQGRSLSEWSLHVRYPTGPEGNRSQSLVMSWTALEEKSGKVPEALPPRRSQRPSRPS